jgi:hypothetical protein
MKSIIIIKDIDDPFKKWDSLLIRFEFSSINRSWTKSYLIYATERPTNITVEIPYYPGLKFEILVESYWWMTESYRLSNLEKYYSLNPNETLILDLAYEIYSNRVYEMISEIKDRILELIEEGFSPPLWVSEIDTLIKEGISRARSGDYEGAMLNYRRMILLKNRFDEERRKIVLMAPLSCLILYLNALLISIFIKALIEEGKGRFILSFLVYLLISFIFLTFQSDVRLVILHLMPKNMILTTTFGIILLSISFFFIAFVLKTLKDIESLQKLSLIVKLAVLNIRNKSFRYSILIFTTSLTIASIIFSLTLGTVYLRTEIKSFVNHNSTAIVLVGGTMGIQWEDFLWLSSLQSIAIVSPLSFDSITPSLPEGEVVTVKEKGYFFVVNVRSPNITSPIAFRLFLKPEAFRSVYNVTHILLYGRFPRTLNEALISYEKALELGVWMDDSIAYYEYVAHKGYRMVGIYTIVGLFDTEILKETRELYGEKLINLDPYNIYGTIHGKYEFKDVMICFWNEEVDIKRLTILFNKDANLEWLKAVTENIALTRQYEGYIAFFIHGGLASRISYSESLYLHNLPSLIVPISLLILIIFSITLENIQGRTSDYRTLAILGLNPTELKMLAIAEVTLVESLSSFIGYLIGAVFLPCAMGGYVKAGPSYEMIALALALLISAIGAYFPAQRASSVTTLGPSYKWKLAKQVKKEEVSHLLPFKIEFEELPQLDEFLRKTMVQRIMLRGSAINVALKDVKIGGVYREYIYQIIYNTIPFNMSIFVSWEDLAVKVNVKIMKLRFVGKEYYNAILHVFREALLAYKVERS